MGIFSKQTKQAIDETVDDQTWIVQGHQRFDAGKSRHFGSPETMRAGGDQAAAKGDIAAAVFYYSKAIDIAQTWANSRPGQRPIEYDLELFDAYATTLETIHRIRPGADLATDWNNESGKYGLGMMVSITRTYAGQRRNIPELYTHIDRVVAATGLDINKY